MQFDLPKEQSSMIKVIGVGGGGSNAVNHMYRQGIVGVNFVVCNTDAQALDGSPVPNKVQLGPSLTSGRGAGSRPEVGKEAGEESVDEIREILSRNTQMVFITAGMGGGTGTGAAPVVARIARELDILVVGIVTIPFGFEGKKRLKQAEEGIAQLKEYVDTLLVINNEKLREIHGNLRMTEAFNNANNILTTAAKSIAEIITIPGYINTDIEDVKTVMKNSGAAIMGTGVAEGDNRAIHAVTKALSSPLLSDNNVRGARHILLNITSGTDENEVLMDEISEITDYIQNAAGQEAEIIWGNCLDESLGNKLSVTVVVTGFEGNKELAAASEEKTVHSLTDTLLKSPAPVVPEKVEVEIQPTQPELKSELNPANPETPLAPEEKVVFDLNSQPSNLTTEPEPEKPIVNEPLAELKVTIKEEAVPPPVDSKNEKQQTLAQLGSNTEDRVRMLRDLSHKLHSPKGLEEIERTLPFQQKQIQLENPPHSSESIQSRYALSANDNSNKGSNSLLSNNSFLHDNVD